MAKLYRPHIPLKVRVTVAFRQLLARGYTWDERDPEKSQAKRLAGALKALAQLFGCEVSDLRLDHDPPLGARFRHGRGKTTVYSPAANDPEHLNYRPHGPEFAGSHLIKTNVRGDHGQHPDRVLIKREKRRQKAEAEGGAKNLKKKRSIRRSSKSAAKVRPPKRKWASRSMPKGRKFQKRGDANVR